MKSWTRDKGDAQDDLLKYIPTLTFMLGSFISSMLDGTLAINIFSLLLPGNFPVLSRCLSSHQKVFAWLPRSWLCM